MIYYKKYEKNVFTAFSLQTHFFDVLIPEELEKILEECRSYMNSRYKCKSGYATPLHVTLVPLFAFTAFYTTDQLVETVRYALETLEGMNELPFMTALAGFDAFGDRTFFAKPVVSEKWKKLYDAVNRECFLSFSELIRKDPKPF